MTRLIVSVFVTINFWISAALAQDQEAVWIQVEAQPSLNQAQDRVREYSAALPDVNGFALGGGWYGIALGPYTPDDAREVLRTYRREGQIPRDSYIAYTSSFQQQFWPIGANFLNIPAAQEAPQNPADEAPSEEVAAVEPETTITTPDETASEARASEAELTREERERLQIALKWAGHYDASIDGAFGRGTRTSMAAWQDANNHERTGILTTAQRAELFSQYNAVLNGLGLALVQDTAAGIEIKMPTEVVKFSKYSPPFAQYDSSGDINGRVLLISQEGDQNTLYGLYDIMQTLEIVPEDGPRERKGNSFTLVGESATMISHTEAWLENGEIKGFTLIWPAGDEERRSRLLGEMMASFNRLEGAMDPAAGTDEQNIDLVAGLEIRRPKLARSGFFLDSAGHIVTTSEAVANCSSITIEDQFEAEVLINDGPSGIAIVKSKETLSPAQIATLTARDPRLQTEIAVSGFSYEGILGAPTLTFGVLSDVKGLGGEPELKRLALNALPGDAGGPVFDDTGAVMGMLLPAPQGDKKLPDQVSFAVDASTIRKVAGAAGLTANLNGRTGRIAPEDLTLEAQGLTVLISCWE
jgi:peptidoglycan hydrolase-like protein with peptidoglycan-binding domain